MQWVSSFHAVGAVLGSSLQFFYYVHGLQWEDVDVFLTA